MSKASASDLDSQIKKILSTFGEDVKSNLDAITKAVGKKGADAVRANSSATFGGTGKYASGWASKYEQTRLGAKATIYNKTAPGLAHLLENGHALVNGGRVAGKPHIKPVEEEINKEFEEKILSEITGY